MLIDENGIRYKQVSYDKYLKARDKHRIIKHLEAQYYIEFEEEGEK